MSKRHVIKKGFTRLTCWRDGVLIYVL